MPHHCGIHHQPPLIEIVDYKPADDLDRAAHVPSALSKKVERIIISAFFAGMVLGAAPTAWAVVVITNHLKH